jgi:plasmid maintenance system antidote protein VapI
MVAMTPTTSPFRGSVLLRNALACPTEPLNQAAIALQLGVAQQTVANWVSGRSRPSPHAMIELEWLFGIDPTAWNYPGEIARADKRDAAEARALKEVA